MAVDLLYSQGTRRAGPMQSSHIAIGSGTSGAALTVADCTIPGTSGSNPHASAFTITSSNNFATAGVAVGDLVEGTHIKPNTYVLTVSTTTLTVTRLPNNTTNSAIGSQTLTFFKTPGAGATVSFPTRSGFNLIAGSNLTITESATTGSATPTYTFASTASGTGDVAAGSNFGTDNVLIRSDGASGKDVQATGITVADTTNNMSGIGSISSKQITIAPGSTAGAAALTLTATDVDQIGLDINASNTTANVIDIAADSVTTGSVIEITADALTSGEIFKAHSTGLTLADGGTSKAIDIALTNDSTASQTAYGLYVDYNKTGTTASSKTANVYGIMVDIDDSQTNNSNATVTQYGAHLSAVSANATGTITNIGVHAVASGGDNNYAGIFEGDVGIGTTSPDFDLQVESSSSTGPVINIKNTNTANNGGELRFWLADGGNGANGDTLGTISFYGNDDGGSDQVFANVIAKTSDVSAGAEEGKLEFQVATQGSSGSVETVLTIDGGANAAGSTVEVAGSLSVAGDLNITGDVNSTSVTDLDVVDKTITVASGAADSSASDQSGITFGGSGATLQYIHSSTSINVNKPFKLTGTTESSSATTGELIVAGGAGIAKDLSIGDDLRLTSDNAIITMGADAGFNITHDGDTGATIAGAPVTITASEASTWSTSSGALTITSAAACTWSAAAGDLTLDSEAGTANLDGHTGVQITSSNSGNIDLDSVADIVLDPGDDKHIFFQEAGTTHSAIGHGTVEITNIADTAGATTIDTFDCTTYQAVKYLIVVEDVTNDDYMTTEILMLGDENGASAANAFMTIYAVLYNNAELGVFGKSTSGNNVSLTYDPTATGSANHRVRVVANRIASLSDSGQ